MPKSVARITCFSESPPSAFAIDWCETTAWTIAERVKPRMSGQRISQNILKAVKSAWPRAISIVMIFPFPLYHYCSPPLLLISIPPGYGYIIHVSGDSCQEDFKFSRQVSSEGVLRCVLHFTSKRARMGREKCWFAAGGRGLGVWSTRFAARRR